MRFFRDLAIALLAGFVVSLVLAKTGQKHLITVLWAGAAVTAGALGLILLIEWKHWQIRVVASAVGSYLPRFHLSRPKRGIRLWPPKDRVLSDQLVQLGRPAEQASPTEASSPTPPEAPDKITEMGSELSVDEVATLVTEGEALKNELLAARRKPSASPIGGSAAVNVVAPKVKNWNGRVAEVVDRSNLSFSTKMSLAIYNEPMFAITGASAKRLAYVLEDNLAILKRL